MDTRSESSLRAAAAAVILVAVFVMSRTVVSAETMSACYDVCDGTVECSLECLDPYEDESTCGEYGSETCRYFYCGDNYCYENDGENPSSCSADCNPGTSAPYCGDYTCDPGESARTCSQDCSVGNNCGDGLCDVGETLGNCPADCTYADWCENDSQCVSTYGWGYVCRSKRCVALGGSFEFCNVEAGPISCSGAATCVQLESGSMTGICVPRF